MEAHLIEGHHGLSVCVGGLCSLRGYCLVGSLLRSYLFKLYFVRD